MNYRLFPLFLTISGVNGLKCSALSDKSLPCFEVPQCSTGSTANIQINKLSNGLGSSQSHSDLSLCFDDVKLYVNHTAKGQTYLNNPGYKSCNDPVYNADVAEMFIAPNMEATPHCYNELDISPFGIMFDAGIYNPNLNHTGIQGYEFECSGTGVEYSSAISMQDNMWSATLSFTFALLNCPFNCPLAQYYGHSTPNNIYRVNFFRINELISTAKCSSSACEYMAWNPTLVNPPAFHEPSKFGYMLLQL